MLRIANWSGAGEDNDFDKKVEAFYRRFERENPGVEVRVEGIPDGYVPKMILNFVAGTDPDVMTLDASSAAVFIDNGVLQDLTPFVERDKTSFNLGDYYKNVVDIDRRGERLYAIPGDFTPMVVYYNKRIFDRMHIPYPKPGWNFADFEATAKRLNDPSHKVYGFFFANWMPGWVMWLWNDGGDVLTPERRARGAFDSPANERTISFLRDLVKKDQLAPALSETAAQGVDLFANGEAAMTVSGHWAIVGYKNPPNGPDGKPAIDVKELGVVEMPHNTPISHTVMYEAGYGVSAHSKHQELAWKLVKALTSYKWQIQYNATGIAVCARKDVSLERAAEPIERQFLSIVPQARPPFGSQVEGYEAVEKLGQDALSEVLDNGVSVGAALSKAAMRMDREFAKR